MYRAAGAIGHWVMPGTPSIHCLMLQKALPMDRSALGWYHNIVVDSSLNGVDAIDFDGRTQEVPVEQDQATLVVIWS
jgi:hypothetical protein